MDRRSFLTALSALSVAPVHILSAPLKELIITDLEFLILEGERSVSDSRHQSNLQPLHIYEEHRPVPYEKQPAGGGGIFKQHALYLSIKTAEGLEGLYGPIDTPAAVVVDRQLKNFLKGKNALSHEILWDKLFRANRHSRSGHYMMAISAVDNALWDLRGKYFGVPVYQLLGGPSRQKLPVYGSCLGYSVEPDAAGKKAAELKEQGYRHQKWFLAYGPGDGAEGLIKNVELVRSLRESVGDDTDLMFDAFMGWDLNYATSWVRQVEDFRPRWIEEAFHPSKLDSFVQLARETTIPVATGEHFYNRWEVLRFLEAGAISVVQADPEWCGGVSELVKICTIASAFDAHVIPHGHSLHAAAHVVASQSPMTCPLVEYLIIKMKDYYMFEKNPLTPDHGHISLPDRPGFGIEFEESKIQDKRKISWG